MKRRAFVAMWPLAGCAGAWRGWPPDAVGRPAVAVPRFAEVAGAARLIDAEAAVRGDRALPVTAHVGVSLACGAEEDPPGRAGLTALALAAVLDRGGRDELGRCGAGPVMRWAADGGLLACTTATEQAAAAVTAMATRVRAPRLDEPAFAAAVARAEGEAAVASADPRRTAARALDRAIFGEGHPYAHRGVATAASLRGLTREQLGAHAQRVLQPGRTLWITTGAARAVQAAIAAAWAGWTGPAVVRSGPVAPAAGLREAITLVDWPEAEQAVLCVGRVGPAAGSRDGVFARRAMRILRSAVHERLRGDRGLAYYTDAGLDEGRLAGRVRLTTQVDAGAVGEALRVVLWSAEHVQELAVGQAWMDEQDTYDALEEVFTHDAADARVAALARRHRLGLPPPEEATATPAKRLAEVIDELLRVARLQVVCLGDRRRVLGQLERFGPVVVRPWV